MTELTEWWNGLTGLQQTFYGIGTLFSMALLTVMVTLALDMVIAVGMSFWVTSTLGFGGEDVTSMAMQQGGLGLILTALIVSAPPMAAMLFQGTLGQFTPYSAFQPSQQPGAPGQPGYAGVSVGAQPPSPPQSIYPSPRAMNTQHN